MRLTSNQRTIILCAVVFLVLIAIYYIGRAKGNLNAASGNKGKLPEETDWGRQLTAEESALIKQHAAAMYKDMKGLNVWARDLSIYTSYLGSTDRVFVGAANYFYENYGRGENLAQWIDGESFNWTNIGSGDIKNDILARLAKHGINV